MADGHGQRSLANARRPDEAKDGALGILDELADGQEFQNTVFHFFQAVMLRVEDFLCRLDVPNLFRTLLPGHGKQPVNIVAADGGFRGHRRHQFQALQLRAGLFQDVLGHAGGIDFLFQLFDFILLAPAEFLLNSLELFVEVILFLRAFHLALHASIDVAVDVQLFKFDSISRMSDTRFKRSSGSAVSSKSCFSSTGS